MRHSVVVSNATCLMQSDRGPPNSSWQEARSTPVFGLEHHTGDKKCLGLSRSVEPNSYGRQLNFHAEKCKTITDNSRKEHHHIHHDAKIRQSPHHFLTDNQRESDGIEETDSQVRYRAKWRHASPRKPQRYESRNSKESTRNCLKTPCKGLDQKSPLMSLDLKRWLEDQFREQQMSKSLEKFRNKVSPFRIAKRIHHSYTKLNSAMRFRPTPTRKASSSERCRHISPSRDRRDFHSFSMHRDKIPDHPLHRQDEYRTYRVKKHRSWSHEDTSLGSCRRKHSPLRYHPDEIVGIAPENGVIVQREDGSPRNSSRKRAVVRLSFALDELHTGDCRFVLVPPPNFEGEHPGRSQRAFHHSSPSIYLTRRLVARRLIKITPMPQRNHTFTNIHAFSGIQTRA
ncbi:hypothetical protein TNCV_1135701 [Trichonephila clavipes]|nr:hypothetical protein TNCV_1135701 [Trichonephila clavipes]